MKNRFLGRLQRLIFKRRTIPLGHEAGNDNELLKPTAISPEKQLFIFMREPLINKGIRKKARDIFREWHDIVPISDDVPEEELEQARKVIEEFNQRVQTKAKLMKATISAMVYGDGFLEVGYKELEDVSAEDAPPENAEIDNLYLVKGSTISKVEFDDYHEVLYWIQMQGAEEKKIHRDRILHICIDPRPDNIFGVSKIDLAYKVLLSKMNADEAHGEILWRFGKGFVVIQAPNMTDDEQKKLEEAITKKLSPKSIFVGDDSYKVDVKNPTTIDPKPFDDYFYTNIAAALEMPKLILLGTEAGSISGSALNLTEYFNDIKNIQETVFTPLLTWLYQKVLRSKGLEWKYKIQWNPLYVDEKSEAEILNKRADAIDKLFGRNGIITEDEARKIAEQGIIPLPSLEPEEPIEPEEPEEEHLHIEEMQDKHYNLIEKLSELEKQRIEEERRLGEKALEEGLAA